MSLRAVLVVFQIYVYMHLTVLTQITKHVYRVSLYSVDTRPSNALDEIVFANHKSQFASFARWNDFHSDRLGAIGEKRIAFLVVWSTHTTSIFVILTIEHVLLLLLLKKKYALGNTIQVVVKN